MLFQNHFLEPNYVKLFVVEATINTFFNLYYEMNLKYIL